MSSKPKLSDEKFETNEKQKSMQQVLNDLNSNKNPLEPLNNNIEESFEIVKDLQNIIQNCSDLTNDQKFDYCKSQRYFMKLYLKNMNKKNL